MASIWCHATDWLVDLDENVEHLDECWRCQMETMVFTVQKLEAFKAAYNENKDEEFFEFDGHEFMPEYAKYMIEFLEKEYAKDPR